MTDRDRAYVLALYKLFGAGEFEMHMIQGRRLPSEIGQRFSVESDKLADKTVLRVRLPELGLIAFDGEHHIKLTEAGLALARGIDASTSELSLVGSYHRFGEIGPVYEVLGQEDEGFVTIRLVESGDTARYPAEEVRNDPIA
jgi:hypothetical protein